MDVGKAFEKGFKQSLKILTDRHLVAHTRLTDSTAARTLVSDVPCDYLLGLPRGSKVEGLVMVELKGSEKKTTLDRSMMTASQRQAIVRYRDMLHIPYFILFWDSINGTLQLWDGIVVVREQKSIDRRDLLAQWDRVGWLRKLDSERVADLLSEHFSIPPLSSTLSTSERRTRT